MTQELIRMLTIYAFIEILMCYGYSFISIKYYL